MFHVKHRRRCERSRLARLRPTLRAPCSSSAGHNRSTDGPMMAPEVHRLTERSAAFQLSAQRGAMRTT